MAMGMPATRAYIAQLDEKAAEMERQADEAEALAAGRGATGYSAWYALNALDRVDALRASARDCREKAHEQRRIVAQYDQ